MSAWAGEVSGAGVPRWLPWLFLGLLVLPFHPHWLDFEQVRRGLLLVLAGGCLVFCKSLRPVHGERLWLLLVGWLLLSACVNLGSQLIAPSADTPLSFQPWEAVYRLAHWGALVIVLRLGATAPSGFSGPCAWVLVATSLFGLLQRAGLGEIAGYGVEREPVSVFGNLNVASEFTAVAAMVVAVSGPLGSSGARGWLRLVALALGAAYLVVNHSRSGLVALPLGLLSLSVLHRRSRGFLPLAFAVAGAACGLLLDKALVLPAPPNPAEAAAAQRRPISTLDVRLEILQGSTRLFAENPVFGHGPGQFAVQYARVRSQQEIELSSLDRQFPTEVRTAHDDWFEMVVDGGLPALGLFALALLALQRSTSDKARLLPLFVLLLLMLVRSPLGNAPAVAAALLLVGQQVQPGRLVVTWQRTVAVALGTGLVLLGLVPIAANCLFVRYQGARAHGDVAPPGAVAAAAACMPFEPRFLQLLAQEQLFAGDLAEARKSAAAAVSLRPFDPQLYELLAEVLVKGKAFDIAMEMVKYALKIDPQHPELRMWMSWLLMQRKETDLAIAAVVIEPHPRLRKHLPQHFRALAEVAKKNGDEQLAARFAVEQHFVSAVETLADRTPAAKAATQAHLEAMLAAMKAAGLPRKDLRSYLVSALHAIDIDAPAVVIQTGQSARALEMPLAGWQRDLLGNKLEPLRRFEPWAVVLDRR